MPTEYISPEGREHPSKYHPDVLFGLLVEDAVRSHATELEWFTVAIQRIGSRRKRGRESLGHATERAMKALLDEVEQLTGHRRLPLHSGVIPGVRG